MSPPPGFGSRMRHLEAAWELWALTTAESISPRGVAALGLIAAACASGIVSARPATAEPSTAGQITTDTLTGVHHDVPDAPERLTTDEAGGLLARILRLADESRRLAESGWNEEARALAQQAAGTVLRLRTAGAPADDPADAEHAEPAMSVELTGGSAPAEPPEFTRVVEAGASTLDGLTAALDRLLPPERDRSAPGLAVALADALAWDHALDAGDPSVALPTVLSGPRYVDPETGSLTLMPRTQFQEAFGHRSPGQMRVALDQAGITPVERALHQLHAARAARPDWLSWPWPAFPAPAPAERPGATALQPWAQLLQIATLRWSGADGLGEIAQHLLAHQRAQDIPMRISALVTASAADAPELGRVLLMEALPGGRVVALDLYAASDVGDWQRFEVALLVGPAAVLPVAALRERPSVHRVRRVLRDDPGVAADLDDLRSVLLDQLDFGDPVAAIAIEWELPVRTTWQLLALSFWERGTGVDEIADVLGIEPDHVRGLLALSLWERGTGVDEIAGMLGIEPDHVRARLLGELLSDGLTVEEAAGQLGLDGEEATLRATTWRVQDWSRSRDLAGRWVAAGLRPEQVADLLRIDAGRATRLVVEALTLGTALSDAQLARRFGVREATVALWRAQAVHGLLPDTEDPALSRRRHAAALLGQA